MLLILGVYIHLTDFLHELETGHLSVEFLITVAVFGSGCAIGLISFSKVLRWLLANFKSPTMAVLCGFMVGALNKIWPFQRDLTPLVEELKYKQYENYWPRGFDTQVILCLVVGTVALALVLGLDWITRRGSKNRDDSPAENGSPAGA